MKLKPDLFPYPVLNKNLDDYVDSEFETHIETKLLSQSVVQVIVEFKVLNSTLQALLNKKKVVFAVHIEGKSSSFRKLYLANPNESVVNIDLNSRDVSNDVEVNTMIIANEDIPKYKNEKFNDVYYSNEFSISIEKGDILAFDEMAIIELGFSNREARGTKSIITVAGIDDKFMKVDVSGNIIQVMLPKSDHAAYQHLSQESSVKKNFLIITVILPALTYTLETIKNGNVDPELEWFNVLERLLSELGYDINNLKNEDALHLSQKLLDFPIFNTIDEFYKAGEIIDET